MILPGMLVVHRPSGRVRRVSGARGEVVHFSQCIQDPDGNYYYWASGSDCEPLL